MQMCGVDLTRIDGIDGIDVTTAFKVLSEIGADMSKFKSAKHFASWLGLCPGTKISDGKVLSAATKRTAEQVLISPTALQGLGNLSLAGLDMDVAVFGQRFSIPFTGQNGTDYLLPRFTHDIGQDFG